MADARKRVLQYPEKTTVDNTDYMLIDSSTGGTNKYQVTRILSEAEAATQTKVDAEAAAREAADNELKSDFLKMLIYEQTDPAAVASFSDGADDMPIKSLKLNIEPHQAGSGDPSTTNLRAISGYTSVNVTRAGKNLLPVSFESQTKNGITLTANSDGTYTANGTATAVTEFTTQAVKSSFYGGKILTGCPSGGGSNTYCICQQVQGSPWTFLASDYGNGATLTETEYEYIRFIIRIENGQTANNLVFKPMVRLASDIDATFEPYSGETYDITIPTSVGAVYGGVLDVATGNLTVDRVFIDLATTTYNLVMSGTNSPSVKRLQVGLLIFKPAVANATPAEKLLSNKYPTIPAGSSGTYGGHTGVSIDTGGGLYICDTSIQTVDAWRASGVTIVAPIATPFEHTLTPTEVTTLLGINNIWMDADGTVEAEYLADTKLYIKKLAGSTEDDMVADANIVSGQYFMVGNTLYKATANIASGGAITPNVNCTRKSLPEALNEINA